MIPDSHNPCVVLLCAPLSPRFLEVGNVTQNALELVGLQANQSYVLRTFAWNALGRHVGLREAEYSI